VEPHQPVIAIIDDDASIRRALARLLRSVGWKAAVFDSAEAFLQAAGQEPLDAITQNYRCEGNWVIMGTPFSLKLGPRH
jgi:FixJ family two-component response regulator